MAKRAETGAMRFGDDWTGIFIRGDNAFDFLHAIGYVLDGHDASDVHKRKLRSLINLLGTANEVNSRAPAQVMKPFGDAVMDGAERELRAALSKIISLTSPGLSHESSALAQTIFEIASEALMEADELEGRR